MYLIKHGNKYEGNDYKYHSRDRAVSRLESAVTSFVFNKNVTELVSNIPRYNSLSIQDKAILTRVFSRIRSWISEMETAMNYDQEIDDSRPFESRADKAAIDKRRTKLEKELNAWNSNKAFINFYERTACMFLFEAEKLIPVAQRYSKLKDDQQLRFTKMLQMMKGWLEATEEAIKPYMNK